LLETLRLFSGKGFFDFPHLMSFDVLDMESDEESSDEELDGLPIDEETQEERRKSRKSFAKVTPLSSIV
jgi:hypothetical protein